MLLVLDGSTAAWARVDIVRAGGAAGPSALLVELRCSTVAA
jgi:hypothetical protein